MVSLTSNQEYGLFGEELALAWIEAQGYHGRLFSRFTDRLDILIEGVLGCHVKISRPKWQKMKPGYYRQYWHFNVSNVPDNQDSLVILICDDQKGCYWYYPLPSWLVWRRSTINITSHPRRYNGRFRDRLDNPSALHELYARRLKQVHQLELPKTQDIFDGTIKKGEQCPLWK